MKDKPEKNTAEAGFLTRWSERKTQNQHLNTDELRTLQPDRDDNTSLAEEVSQEDTEIQEKAVLTDEDMPPLETLDESSDFGGFLSPGVSDALRKAAMKKLFALPSCTVLDGLNDYDDDYTVFEPLGNIVTADMSYRAAIDAEREAKKAARELAAISGDESSEHEGQSDSHHEDPEPISSCKDPLGSEDGEEQSTEAELQKDNTKPLPGKTQLEDTD